MTIQEHVNRFVADLARDNRIAVAVLLNEESYRKLKKTMTNAAYRNMTSPPPSRLTSIDTVAGPLPIRIVRDWPDSLVAVGVAWDEAQS